MSKTFASLAVRNYRWFISGAMVSNIGTWMSRTTQDWLVLTELTEHSAGALGIITGLQFLPILLLAPLAGAWVDRLERRRVLIITQLMMVANSLALCLLVAFDVAELWHVAVLALLQGTTVAADNPARQVFVNEMVSRELVPNAVGLNSMSFNSARLIGPAVAGVIIGVWGIAPSLAVSTLSFFGVLVGLVAIRSQELVDLGERPARSRVRDGLAYLRGRPDLLLVFGVVFMLGTFGLNFQLTLAVMATRVYHKGPEEYGLLGSLMALGTLSGALLAARRGTPRLRVLLGGLAAFSVACAAAALAPSYWVFAVVLVPCGLFAITVLTTATSLVQLATTAELRGRVMALYIAVLVGGTPLGAPIIGWVGDTLGPRWTLLIGAIPCLLTVFAATGFLMVHRGLRARLQGWPPQLKIWQDEGN